MVKWYSVATTLNRGTLEVVGFFESYYEAVRYALSLTTEEYIPVNCEDDGATFLYRGNFTTIIDAAEKTNDFLNKVTGR
jgi:hypothetical protein